MKKRTLLLISSFILTASLILPVGLDFYKQPAGFPAQPASAALVCTDGFYIYTANPVVCSGENQWLVEIWTPVEFDSSRNLPNSFSPYGGNDSYIPEIVAIVICGLVGMGLAQTPRKTQG